MRCKDIGNGPRADNCQKAVKTAKSGSNSGIPYSIQSIKSIGHLGHINDTCTKTLQYCFLQVFKVDQIQDRKQSESDVLNKFELQTCVNCASLTRIYVLNLMPFLT